MHVETALPPAISRRNERLRNLVCLLLIVVINVIVYAPSFFLPFEDGDQMVYLAELRHARSLSDALSHYDYPVSRHFEKGDEILFRPFLFGWLGLQYHFFSYHYVYWNLAAFMLHLAVVFLLFGFLSAHQPKMTAVLVAILFSIYSETIWLVLFTHASGYIAGFALLMLALMITKKLESVEIRHHGKWAALWIAAVTAGALFYEPILPFSWVVIGYLFFQRRRSHTKLSGLSLSLLLLPTVIYFFLYIPHRLGARLGYIDGMDDLFTGRNPLSFPWMVLDDLQYGLRVCLRPIFWELAALLPVLMIYKGVTIESIKRKLPILTLLIGLILVYLSIVVFGRDGSLPSYYFYLFFLLIVMSAAVVIDIRSWIGMKKMCVIALLIGMNCHMFIRSGLVIYRAFFENRANHHYFSLLIRFVDQHKREPEFSFKIERPFATYDSLTQFSEGYPGDPNRRRHEEHLSKLLFSRYYEPRNPKYRLRWKGREFQVIARSGSISVGRT